MAKQSISKMAAAAVKYIRETLNAKFFLSHNGEPMISLGKGNPNDNYYIESKPFRSKLIIISRYLKFSPTKSLLEVLIAELIAYAHVSQEHKDVFIRNAYFDSKVIIDLGRQDGKFLEISENGYEIKNDNCPVVFIRPDQQLPLPIPIKFPCDNNFLSIFKKNFGIRTNSKGWLLSLVFALKCMLRDGGAFVFLVALGQKGSGKSYYTGNLKSLIDPGNPLLIKANSLKKGDETLITASRNRYLTICDNVSHISNDFSDSLCIASTGGGLTARELYTNHDEMAYILHNPFIFNGISELTSRPDFLDRIVTLEIPLIPMENRVSLTSLKKQFQDDYPYLLGGLYDLMSKCLKILPEIQHNDLPRMTDYARLGIAAEQVLKLKPGTFLQAYTQNLNSETDKAFEANEVCVAIYSYLEKKGECIGTADELRTSLFRGERPGGPRGPKSAAHMGYELKRAIELLRYKGIVVEKSERTSRVRCTYRISWEKPDQHPMPTFSGTVRTFKSKKNKVEDYDLL